MEKIIFNEESTTKEIVLKKLSELEKEILDEKRKLTYLGDKLLGNILFGLEGVLPNGLLSIQDLSDAVINYELALITKKVMDKFGIKETDIPKSKLRVVDLKTACKMINGLIDYYNLILRTESVQTVVLKSTHPDEYENLEISCRVIPNDMIGEYLSRIPEDRKFYAYKSADVEARIGYVGEEVKTELKTVVDGREYILSEENNVVKSRNYDGVEMPDIVIKNVNSTSNEEYVVRRDKFYKTYDIIEIYVDNSGEQIFVSKPEYDSRLLTQVDENVIIMTSWGAPAVCLAGSYIVTYNAESNDYNTSEQGAFDSTYTVEEQKTKKLNQ